MIRTLLLLVSVAALAAWLTPSEAQAWGACHTSYTTVTPTGYSHTSSTMAAGAYGGAYAGGRSVGYNPAYGMSASQYGYASGPYGGYAAGGFRAGGVSGDAYQAGFVRRW
jgi:hypothetical protein